MSQASSRIHQGIVRFSDVDWNTYSRLLRAFAHRPRVRLTYDRGELEIMTPRLDHDDDSRFLGGLVVALTQELGLPIKRGGSTTLRRRLRRRGIEADECFWIAHAHLMAGRRQLDLRRDPPPDLAIEVDVTASSLDRLGIFAALRVPEVWRLEGNLLTFLLLNARGEYEASSRSRAFPLVSPDDLMRFVQLARESPDENEVEARFREWIRQATGKRPGS